MASYLNTKYSSFMQPDQDGNICRRLYPVRKDCIRVHVLIRLLMGQARMILIFMERSVGGHCL